MPIAKNSQGAASRNRIWEECTKVRIFAAQHLQTENPFRLFLKLVESVARYCIYDICSSSHQAHRLFAVYTALHKVLKGKSGQAHSPYHRVSWKWTKTVDKTESTHTGHIGDGKDVITEKQDSHIIHYQYLSISFDRNSRGTPQARTRGRRALVAASRVDRSTARRFNQKVLLCAWKTFENP